MAKPPKDIDTGERDAIKDEIRDEVTAEFETPAPHHGISSETIRRLARNEARPIARTVAKDEMEAHEGRCRDPGGPLCNVEQKVKTLDEKVDKIGTLVTRGMAIVSLLVFAAPIGTALWLNQRSNSRAADSLRETINAAAEVAKQLKAVQDAARSGHTQLEPVRDTRLVQTFYASTRRAVP